MRFQVDTHASPEQVSRALTDFSDRRLHIWNRTLDPARYQVLDQGDTWAVAREATPRSPFWVVARYDWSDPLRIRWTLIESSYGGGGTGLIRIEPRSGGGSRLIVEWDYTGARRSQLVPLFLIHHGPMAWLIARLWRSALDGYAEADRRQAS